MLTASLSHSRAITVIKDPIHDSVKLSCYEREIVDSAFFQRLHFILQNSTTYVAFPSNKNSRFSHSIGVSHLCGQLLTNGLSNASTRDLDEFLQSAADFLTSHFIVGGDGTEPEELKTGWERTVSGQSQFRHSPFLKTNDSSTENNSTISLSKTYGEFSAAFIVDTLWQTIRICGLVHDIGHLPMSHSLEGALKQFKTTFLNDENTEESGSSSWKSRNEELSLQFAEITGHKDYLAVIKEFDKILPIAFGKYYDEEAFSDGLRDFPLHEKRGLLTFLKLYRENGMKFKAEAKEYRKLLYKFAFLILFSTVRSDQDGLSVTDDQAFAPFFKVLKSIVAGAVDGDRMDYTMRDGMSSGTTIGTFDVDRVVDNSVIYSDRDSSRSHFRLGFFYRGLSGIEQFFTQRQQGYKYLIYHRTSSRTEACLQKLVSMLLKYCFKYPDKKISKLVEQFGYIERRHDEYTYNIFPTSDWTLKNLDDSNLRTLLIWLETHIEKKLDSYHSIEKMELQKLRPFLKIVLYREFVHIYDPIKNGSLTSRLRAALKDSYNECDFESVVNCIVNSQSVRREFIHKAERYFRETLNEKCTVVINVQLPKIYDHVYSTTKGEEIYLLHSPIGEDGRVPATAITERSPTLGNMPKMFRDEFRINCYFVEENLKDSDLYDRNVGKSDEINKIFDGFLLSSYPEVLEKAKIMYSKGDK